MGGIMVTIADINAIAERAARSARKDVFEPPRCTGLTAPRLPSRRGTEGGFEAPKMGVFSLKPAVEPPAASDMARREARDETIRARTSRTRAALEVVAHREGTRPQERPRILLVRR
jgi:hypothetical protein